MERINQVHALCWSESVKTETCSNCIWLERDRNENECSNQETVICPLYRAEISRELSRETESDLESIITTDLGPSAFKLRFSKNDGISPEWRSKKPSGEKGATPAKASAARRYIIHPFSSREVIDERTSSKVLESKAHRAKTYWKI